MESKYSGILIDAFSTVLESFSTSQVVSANVHAPQAQVDTADISVTIGFVGDVDGRVYMNMSAETGQILASEMLGGMEITEVDELVVSAVSELCNMIMGNACSSICEGDAQVDITPPVVTINEKKSTDGMQASYDISILLKDMGNVDLNVAV